ETREFDLDHLIVCMIYSWCPTQTRLTLRANRLLFLPINAETLRIKPAPGLRLPVIVSARRAIKINAILAGYAHQQFCLDIACIHEVCAWKEILLLKRFVDWLHCVTIARRSSGRFHMRD